MVEPDGDGSHPTVDLEMHADVPEPQGGMDATAQMGHSIRTASGVRELIRLVEARHDIPPKLRIQKLASTWEEAPQKFKGQILCAMKRIARTSKKPKYPIFYGLKSLIRIAFQQVDLQKLTCRTA